MNRITLKPFNVKNLASLMLLFALTCEKNLNTPEQEDINMTTRIVSLDSVNVREYDINKLEYPHLPYSRWELTRFDDYPQDDDGIILFEWQGRRFYNPTQMSQKLMQFLESYRRVKEEKYIVQAKKFAEKLLELSVSQDGALFFPFSFDWYLKEKVLILSPPWYSGMAQGQALSAFIRLYHFSGDERYLDKANQIRTSLTQLKGLYDPWVVCTDNEKYYWIEEYPEDDPNHVLNGFIFALWGLYDHYRITEDSTSLHLLRAGITTVADHIESWRNPGSVSKYTFKYHTTSKTYHMVHIKELERLAKVTGNAFFQNMADIFRQDYCE